MADSPQFPNVTITGGAGYVGSALVPYLLDNGYRVTVVDLMMYGDRSYVYGGHASSDQLTVLQKDIRDSEAMRRAFEGQDAVIHLACVSNDPSFELDPELGKSINYDSFHGILDAARGAGVKRFINASSSSVYGVRDEDEVTEESPCTPLTDYSKYKLLCEETLAATDMGKTEWVTLRPATVCGYSLRLRLDVVVNILTINALARGNITVFGGSQLRPNIHIDDMKRAYLATLEASSEKIARRTYNVGTENLPVSEIAELVRSVLNDPSLTISTELSDDLRSYHINSQRIADDLGFHTQYSVRNAIESIRDAYVGGRIPDALTDSAYYNIKRMQEIGAEEDGMLVRPSAD
jgi:nucleoside-diphosphate-sugar epimerase